MPFSCSAVRSFAVVHAKAARGTDARRFPSGNTLTRDQANFVYAQSYDTVMPVGSLADGRELEPGAALFGTWSTADELTLRLQELLPAA